MHHRVVNNDNGRRTVVARLEMGEEAVATLTALAHELQLGASSIMGVGGFERLTVGFFDFANRTFHKNEVDEQVELLSMLGNVAETADGQPSLHIHVVVGRIDASTRGGHLVEGIVRPTMEVVIEESPGHLKRTHDDQTGLTLLRP
ncbi:PPC domain-containing DNA-binding protein [Gemmatimonas sp.]|jgi:predicted DNA-binding protein with PD1-like motif|uniref:PPC domain-containing DNA-binding protein n=1 Tax=Gemmatimonas sp. TaxID=1962908 RepID=UPI0022C9CAEB|nr:PPC domain-containing DNA-binding protein [Gemmatimonas sp.]MCZ8205836.1 DNA-binding protein [Gemmatimonas sp.]